MSSHSLCCVSNKKLLKTFSFQMGARTWATLSLACSPWLSNGYIPSFHPGYPGSILGQGTKISLQDHSSVSKIIINTHSSIATITTWMGFPNTSVGKESSCNVEDPGSIPGLGGCSGEGIGYPLQYSWAFLVAQLVKNPPVMQETLVWFLDREDPLEKGMATHSSTLAWRVKWLSQSG